MSRDRFLEALRDELKDVSLMETNDIIGDYREYFRDAQEAGRDEDDVIRALGSPRQLAAVLKGSEAISWRPARSAASADPVARRLAAIIALCFLNFMIVLPVFAAALSLLMALFGGAMVVLAAGCALLASSLPGHGFSGFVKLDIIGQPISNPAVIALTGVAFLIIGFLWGRFDSWLARWFGSEFMRYVRFNIRFARGDN